LTTRLVAALTVLFTLACSRGAAPPKLPTARHLLLVTIDTLRADRVGAYGHRAARTPALDALSRDGTRFERAFATAPITLTSHASLLTGLYPPGHGARHNGLRVTPGTRSLPAILRNSGFATAAVVAAFPLDRRFGLEAGFDLYSDRMPRDGRGRSLNERSGREVSDEAIAWLERQRERRTFLWVHFFEPHAPYLDPSGTGRPASERYDDEVAAADRETQRLLTALGDRARETLVVVASDHGEAFGEHGETGHSLFVYDTTLRVPLMLRGPGVPAGRVVAEAVSLIDVVPTVMRLLGLPPPDTDGIDLGPALAGRPVAGRELYAESFAPLLDFGWSPLRALRSGGMKAIAAPRPELYDIVRDPEESSDLAPAAPSDRRYASPSLSAPESVAVAPAALGTLLARIETYGPADLPAGSHPARAEPGTAARLAALGYLQGASTPKAGRPDPKDRRDLAARIAEVTSGEAQGARLLSLLTGIVREDPHNGQMQLRLADMLLTTGNPRQAERHFEAAIEARVPSADPYIGLAMCHAGRGRREAAMATLLEGNRVEPGNPIVQANIGLLEAQRGNNEPAIAALRRAVDLDPGFHEARFNLALALARAGRRGEAQGEAAELLARLPPTAPQRSEVERLLAALR